MTERCPCARDPELSLALLQLARHAGADHNAARFRADVLLVPLVRGDSSPGAKPDQSLTGTCLCIEPQNSQN